ncbi:MAG: hypothetical protein AAB966_02495 [Patescibacteria group bacterium]
MESIVMFTKADLYSALKQGDPTKQNFLTVVDDPEGGFKIKVIPKGETKYSPDGNEGPVVVCFYSFMPDQNFIGPQAEKNKIDVEDLYKRLVYMYLSYRVYGKRCFDDDYGADCINGLTEDLQKLNAEIEEGISCLMKDMNS